MNSRENTIKLFTHNSPERIGLWDFWWPETIKNWIEEGYPYTEDENGNKIPKDPIDFFDYDIVSIGGSYDSLPKMGFSEITEDSTEWTVTKNGAGASFKYWKNKSGTPEHIAFEMNSPEIWEKEYKPHMTFNEKRVNLEHIKEAKKTAEEKEKYKVYLGISIFEWLRSSLGDVCMLENMLLCPEWIKDITDSILSMHKSHYEYMFKNTGYPDCAWITDDLGYSNGLFASPKILENLIFKPYKELINWFRKQNNIPSILHSCGNITEALPLIHEVGYVAIHPLEVKAGCDLLKESKKYKDKLAFIGGMDVRICETNDKDLVQKEVSRLCNEMKSIGAMWIFGTDHSVSPRIKYDTYKYMLDAYRENMYY